MNHSPRQGLPEAGLVYANEACAFGVVEDLNLAIWRGAATTESVQTQRTILERIIGTKKQLRALTWLRWNSIQILSFAQPGVREGFEAMTKRLDGVLTKHAVVLSGSGFLAAGIRSGLTSLGMLLQQRVRTEYFSEPEAAVRWLFEDEPRALQQAHMETALGLLQEMDRLPTRRA